MCVCLKNREGGEAGHTAYHRNYGYVQLQVTLIIPDRNTAISGGKNMKCDQINKNHSVRKMALFCTASPFTVPHTVLRTRDELGN